jgi:type II secretion system protein H
MKARVNPGFSLLLDPPPRACGGGLSRASGRVHRGFTLIELMVVVAIMGIVMTIAIPTIYQQFHPESMRKAVSDVMEACSHARARAILNGTETDLVIRPAERQFTVSAAFSRPAPEQNRLFSPDVAGNDWRTPPPAAGGASGEGAFSVKLSEKIIIEGMGINGEDYTEDEVGHVRFYPNGTSDEFSIVLLSDKGERRNITLEVVTGLADVESDVTKFKAR